MRSRTELVTTQLEGSDFDDESDFEDSEEDWQPAKGEQKPKKVKPVGGRGRKSTGGNKNGAKKRGRKPTKKSKKNSSDEEDNISDDDTSEPESAPARKPRKTPKKSADSNVSPTDQPSGSPGSQSPGTAVKPEPTTSTPSPAAKPQPLQRKIVTPLKSFPDKGGFLNLFIFKGDLKDGIVNNAQVCLWRRDGSSLLQKYLRDKTVSANVPQFNSSMVYSCWEDRRADEYLEVKVRCLEQSKQIRVELTDIDELEAKSREEYDNYVATYGTPVPRSNKTRDGNNPNDAGAADGAGGDDDEDDDDDDDEECDEDEAGDDLADGEIEEYDEGEEEETEEVPQEE